MVASVVESEDERIRLWAIGDRIFPAYAAYRRQAAAHSRTVPLIALRRQADTRTAKDGDVPIDPEGTG